MPVENKTNLTYRENLFVHLSSPDCFDQFAHDLERKIWMTKKPMNIGLEIKDGQVKAGLYTSYLHDGIHVEVRLSARPVGIRESKWWFIDFARKSTKVRIGSHVGNLTEMNIHGALLAQRPGQLHDCVTALIQKQMRL